MESNNALSALAKAQKDYLDNFIPKKEIGICLTIEEIKEILLSKELDKDLQIAWLFKFYLRQLLLVSTSYMKELKPLMEMLSGIENECLSRGNGVKGLWVTLFQKHFLSRLHDSTLYQIFTGAIVSDDYCAQIAYDEFQNREQHKQWLQNQKDLEHRKQDL